MLFTALTILSAALSEPMTDCPPRGSAMRDRLIAAGERCADDVRDEQIAAARRRAHVQRGVSFKDRPLPAATQSQIRRMMDREVLFDGLTARYEFPVWKHPDIYCFRVNAKNRLGAYTGWSDFAVALGPGGVLNGLADDSECDSLK